MKHTFNVGLDYKWLDVSTNSTNSITTDTIDVLQPINNEAPVVTLVDGEPVTAREYAYGMLLQEVVTFNKYLKLSLGLRYSQISGISNNNVSTTGGNVWDPLAGIIITPIENINPLCILYNHNFIEVLLTSEDMANHRPSKEEQFEVGFKTEWLITD